MHMAIAAWLQEVHTPPAGASKRSKRPNLAVDGSNSVLPRRRRRLGPEADAHSSSSMAHRSEHPHGQSHLQSPPRGVDAGDMTMLPQSVPQTVSSPFL